MNNMKRKRPQHKPVTQQDNKSGHYLYPLFLILFIIISMFFFIFGENGFYSHERKTHEIKRLKQNITALKARLGSLKTKLTGIKTLKAEAVEQEARLAYLKKPGDMIIKLNHSEWIENTSKEYEKVYLDSKIVSPTDERFIDHHKSIIGFIICLSLAIILTSILTRRKISSNVPGK